MAPRATGPEAARRLGGASASDGPWRPVRPAPAMHAYTPITPHRASSTAAKTGIVRVAPTRQ